MSKRFLITLITLLVIAAGASVAILLTKGYRLTSSKEGKIVAGTGIISVTSVPEGASIFIDGHLTSATNTTISSLPPKSYELKVIKDGFIPWEKKVTVKEGLVSEVKVVLFPSIPTIYPLSYSGAIEPILSPDGTKLAFTAPIATQSSTLKQKGGVYIFTMATQTPISFNRSSGLRQILSSAPDIDFSKAKLKFSPDSKQLLISFKDPERNFLVSADSTTSLSDLRDSTPTLAATLRSWDEDQKAKDEARILAIKDLKVQKIASSAAALKWAPDETKFMYADKTFKVYNLTENKSYDLPQALNYTWLPTSAHVVLVDEGKVSIVESDGSNQSIIYAGGFIDSFVFPWPDASKLVILSSLPTPTASRPNLFGINLK